MPKKKDAKSVKISERALLVLNCAEQRWLSGRGIESWSVSPGRGNGLRFVVTQATVDKLVRDGLLDTSDYWCQPTALGRDVLWAKRAEGWELVSGVGHKPYLKHTPRETEPADPTPAPEQPADGGPKVLRDLLRLE
jgi:hypothetical protein